MRLAERCGLDGLVGEHVAVTGPCGANAALKIGSMVAGMATGADCIDDLGALRHGGVDKAFDGIRAPSTLGSFPRGPTLGDGWPIEKGPRGFLGRLAAHAP